MKTYDIQPQEQNLFNQMKAIRFAGNVVPLSWYKKLQYESEQRPKPHLLAITLLADFCYWYRPVTDQRDEITGQPLPDTKRFAADLLQRSYADMAEMYGCTERQAREAVVFLEERGLVKRHLRTVKTVGGVLANNVLYIEIFPERIGWLSDPYDAVASEAVTLQRHTNTIEEELPSGNSLADKEKPKTPAKQKTPRPRNPMFDAVATVTNSDPGSAGASIKKVAVSLEKAEKITVTPDLLLILYMPGENSWWYTQHFAGKQGKRPTLWNIAPTIKEAHDWYAARQKQQQSRPDQSAVLSQIYQNSQL